MSRQPDPGEPMCAGRRDGTRARLELLAQAASAAAALSGAVRIRARANRLAGLGTLLEGLAGRPAGSDASHNPDRGVSADEAPTGSGGRR